MFMESDLLPRKWTRLLNSLSTKPGEGQVYKDGFKSGMEDSWKGTLSSKVKNG